MPYTLRYHHEVKQDIELIDNKLRKTIAKAIQNRLTTKPEKYAKPLSQDLSGYWKLRVGDYRVVFEIFESEIFILRIMYRKYVYERIKKRL